MDDADVVAAVCRDIVSCAYVGSSPTKAQLVLTVTLVEWVVESIVGVDVWQNLIYVTSMRDSELERHLYAVLLTNNGCNKNAPHCHTVNPDMYNIVMGPGCRIVVESRSDLQRPTLVKVYWVELQAY